MGSQKAELEGKDPTGAIPQAEGMGTVACPIYYLFSSDTTLSSLLREAPLDSRELKHTRDETQQEQLNLK